jgi:hypothetical protein
MPSTSSNDPDQRAERFLAAWKRGVAFAGESYFQVEVPNVAEATHRNQLRPDYATVEDAIGRISTGQGAFLAAMYSFFNAEDGQRLLARAGYSNICDLAAKLEGAHAEVIAELFLNYHGW